MVSYPRTILRGGIALAILALVPFAAGAVVQFTHVSTAAGIQGHLQGGTTLHNLGVAWIDIDEDLCPDLFIPNGYDHSAHLYRNDDCAGTFTERLDLLPAFPNVEMSGAVFADYDNDGDQDLYVFVSNEQFDLFGANNPDGPANMLLQNQFVENGSQIIDGQPLFVDVATAAGLGDEPGVPYGPYSGRRSMSGGWLDYDRDGCVDLYVVEMVLQAATSEATGDHLYRNNCDGTFTETTATAGVDDGSDPDRRRPGLAFLGGHFDNDMWPDMYVVNVHEASPHHEDLLYKNRRNGTFQETLTADPEIGDDAGSGMGIDVADIDHDGNWDVYISDVFFSTNDELPFGNPFYRGSGGGRFEENSAVDRGIDGEFSWGVNFFDVDQDGWEDLLVGTTIGFPKMYMNQGDGTFVDVGGTSGLRERNTRGTALADYDRDGDLDVALVHYDGALDLYRNDTTEAGNWLQVKLVGAESNRSAINAVVRARRGPLRLMRQVRGGSSAHSQDDLVVHFGLGSATRVAVEVLWPSGRLSRLFGLDVNQLVVVEEPVAQP